MPAERVNDLEASIGEVLRRARRARRLTLRDVEAESGGQFTASATASYERGERSISLARFCELAQLYGVPAERLLAEALERASPAARREIVVALDRLPLVEQDAGRAVAAFAHDVKVRRQDLSHVITLRSGDLEAISLELGTSADVLLEKITPALQGRDR